MLEFDDLASLKDCYIWLVSSHVRFSNLAHVWQCTDVDSLVHALRAANVEVSRLISSPSKKRQVTKLFAEIQCLITGRIHIQSIMKGLEFIRKASDYTRYPLPNPHLYLNKRFDMFTWSGLITAPLSVQQVFGNPNLVREIS